MTAALDFFLKWNALLQSVVMQDLYRILISN